MTSRSWMTVAVLAAHACGTAAAQQADPLELAPPIIAYEYRLDISVEPHPQGLKVTAIRPGSPVLQMRSPTDANVIARMDLGDRITHVGGAKIGTVQEIHAALNAAGTQARLRLLDVNTGAAKDWDVRPIRITVRANRTPPPFDPNHKPVLYAILAANTRDPVIGAGAQASLLQLESLIESRVHAPQLKLTVLKDEKCTAEEIVRTLAVLPTFPEDTILVYYLGHGEFDPRFGAGDASNGHFLDFQGKDLMRRTVWQYLEDAPAKLRVVITDACNVESEADPYRYAAEMRVRIVPVQGPTNLEWLLMGHTGRLDLTAASRGQYAWYSNKKGGFFSIQMRDLAADFALRDWEPLLNRLRVNVDRYYLDERASILAAPGDLAPATLNRLDAQDHMWTQVFRKQLVRDATPPVDATLMRQIEDTTVTFRSIP